MGIHQLASVLGIDLGQGISKTPLFVKKIVEVTHPLFPNTKVPTLVYENGPLAQQHGIKGIVVDTISHIFGQDLRIIEARNNSKKIELQDWGTLERLYLTFLEALKHLPCWVIVNCHTTYDKNDNGTFYYYPLIKGQAKERIREFFDVVAYTKVSNDKKAYSWQTFADSSKMAKDRIAVLDPTMPQDFKTIVDRYRAKGYEPKIMVLGESGTGKSKAISTLSKL